MLRVQVYKASESRRVYKFACQLFRSQWQGWLMSMSSDANCDIHKATEGHRTFDFKQGISDDIIIIGTNDKG